MDSIASPAQKFAAATARKKYQITAEFIETFDFPCEIFNDSQRLLMSSLQVAVFKINGLIVLKSRDNVYLSNRMNTLIRVLYLDFYSPFAKPVEIINFIFILSLS
jgi:hypothetical protein